jgi:ribokinase
MSQSILIVGSLNVDLVAFVDRLPMAGETRAAHRFSTLAGGKGANQACAVGRLGGRGRMVGAVGHDTFGNLLLTTLGEAGVETQHVRRIENVATGVAMIHVAESGENHIVIAAGANGLLTPADVERAFDSIEEGILLLQLEVPLPTVVAAAKLAKSRGMTVLLDPAPVQALPPELLACVDVLTPNETEAIALVGRNRPLDSLEDVQEVARQLKNLGVSQVIVKLGGRGAWVEDAGGGRHHAAPRVTPVDTTAAGDTFNGAVGVRLAEGESIDKAIEWANRAAAISVTREGAQSSIPTREEVEKFVETQRT